MLLSIVIPVYNIAEYIGRCLDTCLAQTLQGGYEIICINDGSKDNSLQVLREYESKYPIVRVIDQPNGGVSSARNAGIREAKGEYIWFVDGDDWIAEGCLRVVENAFEEKKQKPDTVLFALDICEKYSQSHGLQDAYEVEWQGTYGGLKNSYSNSVCSRWMRTEIIKKHHIEFNPKMKYGEDTLFISQYTMKCSSTMAIHAPLYYYFRRAESAMNRIDAAAHCYCMLNLVMAYKQSAEQTADGDVKKRMKNAVIRAMQAVCRDLCLYCYDKEFVRCFLLALKRKSLYPFGVDWKQFKRDTKQSLKNDLLNWLFGLLSWQPYFWLCWYLCGVLFKEKRVQTFQMALFNDILIDDGENNE